uniref:Large ribosomal subunit protein uL29c n=1 Tax=Titanophycus setchellii TaxID=940129 RepID=A0A1G4NY62_9FLOR|nr:Ribosomal protein L29 [Titanophycus setchellii]SCW23641.1 Ribosomal protein L29 [Titanophycus setchellii]
MSIMSIKEIRAMNNNDIDNKILEIKKILLEYRIKQATRQSLKPHLIKQKKKELAQIMTIKQEKIIHSAVN